MRNDGFLTFARRLAALPGHKMYGPTGVGFLWGKSEILEVRKTCLNDMDRYIIEFFFFKGRII